MIVGEGNPGSYGSRIVELELDLAKAREEVYRLQKALNNAHEANRKMSAEIADLRQMLGVSVSDVVVTYEVTNE